MERLLQHRSAAKGWVTRVSNNIMKLLARQEPPVTVSELEDAIEEFDKRLLKKEKYPSTI